MSAAPWDADTFLAARGLDVREDGPLWNISAVELRSLVTAAHRAGQQVGQRAGNGYAWLIEITNPTRWWDGAGHDSWTTDANKAVRFARRSDAEAVIRLSRANEFAVRMVGASATEHGWSAAALDDGGARDEGGSATR